jgi:hypothetical protein
VKTPAMRSSAPAWQPATISLEAKPYSPRTRELCGCAALADGFVIAVLYGAKSQWVRNVMAAGRFTLRTKGREYRVRQ